ncbi:hypothetical protein [Thalassolituus oleivorans]|uniref:hypothetical protein n=1 Tax=Thalassolituus oleivorans TaxID=187493 RepID=UPI0023F2CC55|nr:hypothetical protein [Thalassolituus oleivorans]
MNYYEKSSNAKGVMTMELENQDHITEEALEPETQAQKNIWDDEDEDEDDEPTEKPYYESEEPTADNPEADGWRQVHERILKES